MNKFRVGLIGCGVISDKYLATLKDFEIIDLAVCASLDEAESRAKAEQFGIPRVATPDEVIADPNIDCILNLTIPAAHAPISLAALEAGKHVYSEKPFVTDMEDGKKILALAKQKGLYVGNAPDTFLGGRMQTCQELLDSGVIGDATGVSAFVATRGVDRYHPNPDFYYAHGGGPLFDLGPYYLTAMVAMLGPISRVAGMAKKTYEERMIGSLPRRGEMMKVEVGTHINSLLQFENGVQGNLFTSFDVWDTQLPRIEIYGTKGTICLADEDPTDGPNVFGGQVLYKTQADARWSDRPRVRLQEHWNVASNTRDYNDEHRGLGLVDMAYAIQNKRPCRASGDMAMHVFEVMTKILESAATNQFSDIESRCAKPGLLPRDFLASESN